MSEDGFAKANAIFKAVGRDPIPDYVKEEDADLWRRSHIKGISADKTKINDKKVDLVNEPPHYTLRLEVYIDSLGRTQAVDIECLDVIKALGFEDNYYRASALKYIWRADKKGDKLKDLQKAAKFIQFEIERLEHGTRPEKDTK